jgi:hypothetical protein
VRSGVVHAGPGMLLGRGHVRWAWRVGIVGGGAEGVAAHEGPEDTGEENEAEAADYDADYWACA